MKVYSPEKIRNIAIAGHSGSGKTTLCEALLYSTGAINRLGRVEDGNTASDHDPDEIHRKVSISTSIIPCEFKDHKINVLDTPGYADFIGEVIEALRAVNAVLIVVDAVHGVQVQTEEVWRLAEERNLPRLFFVNRLDKENADFVKTVTDLQDAFGKMVVPIQLPIGAEASFSGVADIMTNKAYIYKDGKASKEAFPAELDEQANPYRDQLMEAVAESDDALLEKYLEGQELTEEEVANGTKQALMSGSLSLVLCGSAQKTIGAQELMSKLIYDAPSPVDAGEVVGHKPKTEEEVSLKPAANQPLSAFVFKTVADPYVGKLSYFRVYSGTLKSDSPIYNANKNKKDKVGHLFFVRGKEQIETKEIPAGDIGAAPKLADVSSSDTLCDEGNPLVFDPIVFPEPHISLAVNPKSKEEEEKLSTSLHRLAEEDPTLSFERNVVTHEQVLSGVGDLHIDIVLDKLKSRFHVEAETSIPEIAYKESIKGTAKVQGKYKKQTGGRGQYGDVWIQIEPLPHGGGFEFVDKIVGGAVPRNFIPAVEKGIREALVGGVLTNYPTVDFRVTLFDGSFHPVDSSEMAFKIAGSMAFKQGVKEAKPYLLEPVFDLEITVPEANMGDVMGDLSGRRGKILGMEPLGRRQVIKAQVPLGEIQRYATELRSLTGGRGSYSLKFSHYDEMPTDQARKLIEASQQKEEVSH